MTQARSKDFEIALNAKIDGKTKPVGALGRLEAVAARVARVQGRLDPQMQSCRLVLFAADHGIADEGVSAYPVGVTRQMVMNFANGGAASNVFARANGLDLAVINAGVRGGPFGLEGITDHPQGDGTASYLHGPAMSPDVLYRTMRLGRSIGAEGAYDAVAVGEMGIGNTSSAALICHRLSGAPLKSLVGRGTGLDGDGLLRKFDILSAANDRVTDTLAPERALAEYGGFEIAMMTGAILGAVEAGRLVLIDGFIATAAALAAAQITPATRDAMIFCHMSAEPGHRIVLDVMGARPLLDLDMRLGEGTGAALAWPLVKSAVAMLNEMASFEEAGVSGKL